MIDRTWPGSVVLPELDLTSTLYHYNSEFAKVLKKITMSGYSQQKSNGDVGMHFEFSFYTTI